VRECVAGINAKVMKRLGKSRNELFATLDRPALKPLPSQRYQYAEWKRCTVAPDYHVEVDDHYYSAPYRLLRETLDVRFTDATVELFHKGSRVASHVRSHLEHKHTTIPEHMPSSHRRYAEWSPARMLREAGKIGPATTALFEAIMKAKPQNGLDRAYAPARAPDAAPIQHANIRGRGYYH
jgi:transposase